MALLARNIGVILGQNLTATGEWQIWTGRKLAFLDVFGTWNGAKAVLQQSPDDGVTAISYVPSLTSDGSLESLVVPPGRKVRLLIVGGSSPSLTATLVRQD